MALGHIFITGRQCFLVRITPATFSTRSFTNQHTMYLLGADMSLARPGRKQATATEDFDVHISYLES